MAGMAGWIAAGALLALPGAAALAGPAAEQPGGAVHTPETVTTLSAARLSMAGAWRGELQYRDYQSDQWVGIPVSVTVEAVGDGLTLIRRAVFDDGPRRGAVYITSMEMLAADGTTEYSTSFRAGREPELSTAKLALAGAKDPFHWTIVATREGEDDERPARIRETVTRDGDRLTTLKEVDFTDDQKDEWLARNRVVLVRG